MANNADGRIVIDTELNNQGFSKGVTTMEKKVGGLTGVVKKLGVALASAFAVRGIINFGKECVELGSNVSEVQNVVDTAFGDMTYKVEEFASTAIQRFGMSTLAAKKTASTYMSMAKGMGLTEEMASDMSIALAGLTGDVASFYNISQEAADVKLKSVFTGESESLKDLGVVMTQTNLQAYALEQGITKDISAMSQAEQVALRYGFVMKSLSLANGDFAKTSNSWANQTRILSMQWQEFMSIVGESIITVLTPALRLLNQAVSTLIPLATNLKNIINTLFGVEQEVSAAQEISEAVSEQEALTEEVEETAKAQKKMLANFDEINKLAGDSASDKEEGGAAGAGIFSISVASPEQTEAGQTLSILEKIMAILKPFEKSFKSAFSKIQKSAEKLKKVFANVWKDTKKLGKPIKKFFEDEITSYINTFVEEAGEIVAGLLDTFALVFGDIWTLAIYPSVSQWVTDVGPMLTEFREKCVSTFGNVFSEAKKYFDKIWSEAAAPALQELQFIWSDAWDTVTAKWEEVGEPIFEGIDEAISGTAQLLTDRWNNVIKPIWDKIITAVDEFWTQHGKPLWDEIVGFVGDLALAATDIYNEFILPIVGFVNDELAPVWDWVSDYIIDTLADFLGLLADKVRNILRMFRSIISFLRNAFKGDWDSAWADLVEIGKSYINILIGHIEYAINCIIRALNSVLSSIDPEKMLGVELPADYEVPTISRIPTLNIPRLAAGAVIPPNQEFLAVLGDQKSGTNVEAPLETIKQALLEAMREGGNSSPVKVELYLDGRKLAVNQVRHINEMTKEAGQPVLLV